MNAARAVEALPYATLAAASLKLKREHAAPVLIPKFRGAALEAMEPTRIETIVAGPAETGKTFATLWKLDTLLRETPNASAVIIRKVRADMDSSVLKTWDRVIAIRGGVSKQGGEHPKAYDYANGARVWIIGLDNPGKVLSSGHDWIYVNQAEELTLNEWEILTTRVTGREAVTTTPQIFGDCNPGPSQHWIKNREGLRLLHSRHEDNPALFNEDGTRTAQGEHTLRTLDALTGVRRERLYLGNWVAAEGQVFEEFSRAVHMVKRFDPPSAWRRFLTIDFGYTNPFAAQKWVEDGDGRLYLEREIYRTRTTVEDHAVAIKAMMGPHSYTGIGDCEDPQAIATLARCGVRVEPSVKGPGSVIAGIQVVQQRLRVEDDGRPRLYVMEGSLVERDEELAAARRPLCLVDEFEVYRWSKDVSGRANKEEPVKENDHACDAMRQLVMFLDLGGNVDLVANPPFVVHSETHDWMNV